LCDSSASEPSVSPVGFSRWSGQRLQWPAHEDSGANCTSARHAAQAAFGVLKCFVVQHVNISVNLCGGTALHPCPRSPFQTAAFDEPFQRPFPAQECVVEPAKGLPPANHHVHNCLALPVCGHVADDRPCACTPQAGSVLLKRPVQDGEGQGQGHACPRETFLASMVGNCSLFC
jgi:hypothetical protein